MPVVFGAPGRYVQGPGELGHLGACVARLGRRAFIVLDPVKASRSRCFACTTGRALNAHAEAWPALARSSSAIALWEWAAARCSTSQRP